MVKRVRPDDVDITTESIDFKAKHSASAKNSQSWRYAGGNIQRADSIRINGTDYPDPKDKSLPRRKQESNFFITINSNKAIGYAGVFVAGEGLSNVPEVWPKE